MVENLEYFKVFYYTAKLGSVTGAAGELSISQPAVSQSLKALERSLGVPLFQRASKGVRLTGEGQLLYSYVEKGYEQISLGVEKVKQLLNLELGQVHIGASDMALRFYLLPFLEEFHERHPGIKVIVANAPTPETLQLLRAGKIDFGVVSTPFEQDPGIRMEQVREIEDMFVAGRRFLPYKNKMLDFQELEHLPMIFLEGCTSTRRFLDEYLLGNGVVLYAAKQAGCCLQAYFVKSVFQPEFELATSDMIVQFALRNLGVGCVVRDFAIQDLDSGLLFELRFNKMIPKRQLCVVTSKKAVLPTAAARLLEIMRL